VRVEQAADSAKRRQIDVVALSVSRPAGTSPTSPLGIDARPYLFRPSPPATETKLTQRR